MNQRRKQVTEAKEGPLQLGREKGIGKAPGEREGGRKRPGGVPGRESAPCIHFFAGLSPLKCRERRDLHSVFPCVHHFISSTSDHA